ncbi:hypothetical protein RHDE110596_17615 [Prescottella defluvii]|uniref:hypothetical protein n=1 Tax=Prescottella defluvii TaxID=1323361 RepID=UPI0004F295D1|nr:hypothetical protein [Prescottella defluvii]
MQPGARTESGSSGVSDIDNYLLGSPSAGRVVTSMLVLGIAGAVGLVMASVVATVVTAVVGALVAYAVAHDDDWVRAARRRRSRRRRVWVEPGWTGNSWGGHSVSRRAAL